MDQLSEGMGKLNAEHERPQEEWNTLEAGYQALMHRLADLPYEATRPEG
jgi:hypothetical protein